MKSFLALALVMTSLSSFAQNYQVDSAATKVFYVGKKVTGEHSGNVTVKNGSLNFDGELIKSGEIIVDMNTITSTDITDKDLNGKYVGHIKSADFFNVEKFPEAKLVIKKSKKVKDGLEVEGDLTFIGKTNPITFLVSDLVKSDKGVTAKSNLTINRTKWGLVYGSGSFIKGLGDKAINDEFTLAINLSGKAK